MPLEEAGFTLFAARGKLILPFTTGASSSDPNLSLRVVYGARYLGVESCFYSMLVFPVLLGIVQCGHEVVFYFYRIKTAV